MTVAALTALASAIRVLPTGPSAPTSGQRTGARLALPEGGLRLNTVFDAPVDLSWVTKDVRFRDVLPDVPAAPASPAEQQADRVREVLEALFGGMPIGTASIDESADLDIPDVPVLGSTAPTTPTTPTAVPESAADVASPGVPGVLGRIRGLVPVPMEVPVEVEARWAVTASATAPERDAHGVATDALVDGTDFHSTGLTGPELSLVLPPATAELSSDTTSNLVATRYLHVAVRLSAGGTLRTPWIALPPLMVTVPTLLVPTVLAMFTNKSYATTEGTTPGFALLVVPNGSPLRDARGVVAALEQVTAAARNLTFLPTFAAMLLNLQSLVAALGAYDEARVHFRAADEIENLEHIHLDPGTLGVGRLTAEDSADSLALVGPAARYVDLFVRRGMETHDPNDSGEGGLLRLTAGATLCALVPDLEHAEPPSVPAGAATVQHPPHEWGRDTFHDLISSLRFG